MLNCVCPGFTTSSRSSTGESPAELENPINPYPLSLVYSEQFSSNDQVRARLKLTPRRTVVSPNRRAILMLSGSREPS